MHVITKENPYAQPKILASFISKKKYGNAIFVGIMLDTEAFAISFRGRKQFETLKKLISFTKKIPTIPKTCQGL